MVQPYIPVGYDHQTEDHTLNLNCLFLVIVELWEAKWVGYQGILILEQHSVTEGLWGLDGPELELCRRDPAET